MKLPPVQIYCTLVAQYSRDTTHVSWYRISYTHTSPMPLSPCLMWLHQVCLENGYMCAQVIPVPRVTHERSRLGAGLTQRVGAREGA